MVKFVAELWMISSLLQFDKKTLEVKRAIARKTFDDQFMKYLHVIWRIFTFEYENQLGIIY